MTFAFQLARLPRVEFGPGRLARLPALLAPFGRHLLLVTGARSFLDGPHWAGLAEALAAEGFHWSLLPVAGEPSPELVDAAVRQFRADRIDAVVGLGGGSALDAAKAIAGLLKPGNSVLDHLEGVGPELPYHGPATPFIAVPTTAGTGSEATKNAVLSQHGKGGYKKSFRDERLVAEIAVIDPDLLASCPAAVIAANGMDALTQLLESYVSTRANPFTDALAESGLAHVRDSLPAWYEGRGDPTARRAGMAYAAFLSGVTLAQVGLGSVHGLAAPLGAFFPIPHGVACGSLVAEATAVNVRALRERAPDHPALAKYAAAGRLLAVQPGLDENEAIAALLATLHDWTRRLALPGLGAYGVTPADIPRLVTNCRGSSMQTNPTRLDDAEIAALIAARL